MQLTVRLFAMLREVQQCDRISVAVPSGVTVAELRAAIAQAFPSLVPYLASARIAAALRFVPDHHVVDESQEIALIPPVSGG